MLSNEFLNKYNVDLVDALVINDKMPCFSDEPFYIVNLSEVINAFQRWNNCLPSVKPYYAMKCNPNPAILELLASLGCNFDCASKTELKQILDITKDPKRIIFAHPCKYISHIQFANDNGIDLMTFDSEEELHKIKKYHPNAQLLLRLAVDDSQSLCKFNVKFGCKQENVLNILQLAKKLDMNVAGFSFHVGSGCKSADTYFDALRICKFATDIAKQVGFNINIIDLGGGFMAHTEGVSFEQIAQTINKGIDHYFRDLSHIQFIAEPGRFMVQKSHTLVICVVSKKKTTEGFIYYVNDGVYGSFNCIVFDHQTPDIIPVNIYCDVLYKSQIFGNTCDSLDEIIKSTLLPELNIGDYLYIPYFGAYTSSAKSDGFNGYKVVNYNYVLSKQSI